eukprot:2567376-Alexandrium_andersonii.AAC.1
MGHPRTSIHPAGAHSWHHAVPGRSAPGSLAGLLRRNLGRAALHLMHLRGRESRSSVLRHLEAVLSPSQRRRRQ